MLGPSNLCSSTPHSGGHLSLFKPLPGAIALSGRLTMESGLTGKGLALGRCLRGTCKGREILDRDHLACL